MVIYRMTDVYKSLIRRLVHMQHIEEATVATNPSRPILESFALHLSSTIHKLRVCVRICFKLLKCEADSVEISV